MKIKKLTFIDVALIGFLILASAVAWGVVRFSLSQKHQVPAFQFTEELIVYPSAVKVQAKAETVPAPKPAVAPLPLIPPRVIFKTLPLYPESALAKGLEGTVLLSVFVSKSGDTGKVEVSNSSGVAELDNAAVSAVSEWKFEAASQGGAAVESWYKIPVTFKIKN